MLSDVPVIADRCAVEFQYESGRVRLWAYVIPSDNRSGHYRLDIVTRSEAGVSASMQSGDFSANAGGRKNLSESVISAAPGDWSVQLQIYDRDGHLLCRCKVPSA